MRLIDADEFFKTFSELAIEPYIKAPTVEIPNYGEWVKLDDEWFDYKCNKCGYVFRGYRANFCPWCGADMRGDKNETN